MRTFDASKVDVGKVQDWLMFTGIATFVIGVLNIILALGFDIVQGMLGAGAIIIGLAAHVVTPAVLLGFVRYYYIDVKSGEQSRGDAWSGYHQAIAALIVVAAFLSVLAVTELLGGETRLLRIVPWADLFLAVISTVIVLSNAK